MLDAFLDLFAPESCVGCHRRGAPLCSGCAARLKDPAQNGLRISGCASVTTPWAYEGPARDLVLALKLRGRRGAADPLGDAIARAVAARQLPARVVTWIPGRRRDISERGLDHAEAIARRVAGALALPPVRLLGWAAERTDQAGLDREQRRANLKGAFLAGRVGVPVLVVDDVVTTGATVAAAAHALTTSGAPRVDVAAACRA